MLEAEQKAKELISMTDYVLQQGLHTTLMAEAGMYHCHKYANFLKKTLTLGMFIPCDLEGNVLPDTNDFCGCDNQGLEEDKECRVVCNEKINQFNEAKSRLLFDYKDFNRKGLYYHKGIKSICEWLTDKPYEIIEDLVNDGWTLTLTESALKQIGINNN